jgi:peptidoglycan hydrolase CwlO-like protein
MSVTAVSAISLYSQDPLQQQNGLRQDLLTLQQDLSEGNLNSAQQALWRFQQDLQSVRPQQNGIRSSAEVNPASTMRGDLQALQAALDSGDLAMAEEAFVRMQQDNQQISGTQAGVQEQRSGMTASALPKETDGGDDAVGMAAQQSEKANGNLIDVSA